MKCIPADRFAMFDGSSQERRGFQNTIKLMFEKCGSASSSEEMTKKLPDGVKVKDLPGSYQAIYDEYGVSKESEIPEADPSKWYQHTISNPIIFDTSDTMIPYSWTRLPDGRIVSENSVFYTNGTVCSYEENRGTFCNHPDYSYQINTLEDFLESELAKSGIQPLPDENWHEYKNGTIVFDRLGYKWYPGSGLVTTARDEVFPFRRQTRSEFIDWVQQDQSSALVFVNDDLTELVAPRDFRKDLLGARLVHRIGIVAHSDGWVTTSDGFVVNEKRMTFSEFIEQYRSVTFSTTLPNGRKWPRPFET